MSFANTAALAKAAALSEAKARVAMYEKHLTDPTVSDAAREYLTKTLNAYRKQIETIRNIPLTAW